MQGGSCPADAGQTRVNEHVCPKLLWPLHHSHAHTNSHKGTSPCSEHHLQVRALAAGADVKPDEVLVSGCTDEKGDLQSSVHQIEAASWTVLLHDISNTGAEILSQKASSTPPSTYSNTSWVPRVKSTIFCRKRVFSHFLKHRSETVFLRFLSMMKGIGTHCTICNYQMSLFRIFPMFPFPCCSLGLTHGVFREYPAYTYFFAFIFFSLFILLHSWNCFAIWGLRKIWFNGGILKKLSWASWASDRVNSDIIVFSSDSLLVLQWLS